MAKQKIKLGKLEIEVELPFILYDERGNETYFLGLKGYERWREFDENGNLTYYKNSDGFESWREYNEKGNLTYLRNSTGFESQMEYDENGNETYYRDSNGIEKGTPKSKSCQGKVVEIDGKKYELKEVK